MRRGPAGLESSGWAARELPMLAALWPVLLLDVPLSLVIDTVFLPVSLLNELHRGGIDVDGF